MGLLLSKVRAQGTWLGLVLYGLICVYIAGSMTRWVMVGRGEGKLERGWVGRGRVAWLGEDGSRCAVGVGRKAREQGWKSDEQRSQESGCSDNSSNSSRPVLFGFWVHGEGSPDSQPQSRVLSFAIFFPKKKQCPHDVFQAPSFLVCFISFPPHFFFIISFLFIYIYIILHIYNHCTTTMIPYPPGGQKSLQARGKKSWKPTHRGRSYQRPQGMHTCRIYLFISRCILSV